MVVCNMKVMVVTRVAANSGNDRVSNFRISLQNICFTGKLPYTSTLRYIQAYYTTNLHDHDVCASVIMQKKKKLKKLRGSFSRRTVQR